jgi:hypothetical protein
VDRRASDQAVRQQPIGRVDFVGDVLRPTASPGELIDVPRGARLDPRFTPITSDLSQSRIAREAETVWQGSATETRRLERCNLFVAVTAAMKREVKS